MSNLSQTTTLPTELIYEILSKMRLPHTSPQNQRDLAAISTVCRAFRAYLVETIFRRAECAVPNRLNKLYEILTSNPSLISHLHSFAIVYNLVEQDHGHQNTVARTLDMIRELGCRKLQNLSIIDTPDLNDHHQTDWLSLSPELQLSLNQIVQTTSPVHRLQRLNLSYAKISASFLRAILRSPITSLSLRSVVVCDTDWSRHLNIEEGTSEGTPHHEENLCTRGLQKLYITDASSTLQIILCEACRLSGNRNSFELANLHTVTLLLAQNQVLNLPAIESVLRVTAPKLRLILVENERVSRWSAEEEEDGFDENQEGEESGEVEGDIKESCVSTLWSKEDLGRNRRPAMRVEVRLRRLLQSYPRIRLRSLFR